MSDAARIVAALALLTVVAACDGNGRDTPTPIPTAPTTPTLPTVTVTRLEVNGPSSMAPGQSAQFTVIAHLSDSTTMEPTGVRWIASPPSFLQVDQTGRATAGPEVGGAAVTAEIKVAGAPGGEVRGSKGVLVLHDGTFMLVGTVSDAEFFPAPIEGAVVDISPGALSASTNADGLLPI